MKDFKVANEFFLFTEFRSKRFNKSRFQGGEIKKRATSKNYSKSFVIVLKSTRLFMQEMLTNSRVLGSRVIERFAKTKKDRSILGNLASFDAFLVHTV